MTITGIQCPGLVCSIDHRFALSTECVRLLLFVIVLVPLSAIVVGSGSEHSTYPTARICAATSERQPQRDRNIRTMGKSIVGRNLYAVVA
jgi:hypothetical protein